MCLLFVPCVLRLFFWLVGVCVCSLLLSCFAMLVMLLFLNYVIVEIVVDCFVLLLCWLCVCFCLLGVCVRLLLSFLLCSLWCLFSVCFVVLLCLSSC